MVLTVDVILLILALVCFVLVAAGVPTPRVNLLGLGLAFYVLTLLV